MFYVYGVNMSVALKAAKKKCLDYEGYGEKRRKLSPTEYQTKLDAMTKAKFDRMKPVRLSHSLSTPTLCKEFIALAKGQEAHKHIEIRYRKPTDKINPKTHKVIMEWTVYTGAAA